MYKILIPFIIILINSVILPFIQKDLLKNISSFELTINTWIIGGIIGSILLLLIPKFKNINFIKKNNINIDYNFLNNKKYYYIITILLIIGIFSSFSYYYLLDILDVKKLLTYLIPIRIITITLISYFLFDETINFGSFIGLLFIIIGIIIKFYYEESNNL